MAIDGTTTNPINQATSSRETHDGPFYFKLESQPEPGADATVPSDGLKRGVNATSNVEISSKKKKKGKQKELDKGNSSTSRYSFNLFKVLAEVTNRNSKIRPY